MSYRFLIPLAGIMLLLGKAVVASELTLEQAVQLALDKDPAFRINAARSAAFAEQSVADNALPDPKLKLGWMNYPTDTFDREQEPMTQVQIGIQQMFPAGDTLKYKSLKTRSLAEQQGSLAENQRRILLRDVRQAWLEWYYWHAAARIVQQNRDLYARLVKITESQYSSGRQKQQDVIRAELELGMLDDRLVNINNQIKVATATLLKFIGQDYQNHTPVAAFPLLPEPANQAVEQHPMIQAAEQKVSAAQHDIALARQSYKPSWMLDLTYGDRVGTNMDGSERADFLSAMVILDVPLFTGNDQDRQVAASKYQLDGDRLNLQNQQLELKRMLQSTYATWQSLAARVEQFEKSLVPMAKENARAALYAYQSRGSGFNELMRARILQLETELNMLRLKVDRAATQAQLLYLLGEKS